MMGTKTESFSGSQFGLGVEALDDAARKLSGVATAQQDGESRAMIWRSKAADRERTWTKSSH